MERLDSGRDDDAFSLQYGVADRTCISRTLSAMRLPKSARGLIRLGELGEDRLLEQLLPHLPLGKGVVAGAGEDCAVVKPPVGGDFLVMKTDCIIEGVHFLRGVNPLEIGWKAMMRPLSDFAATSAVPQFVLITLITSAQTEVEWVKQLYRGLRRAARRFKVSIVGGETSSTPGPTAISASVVGFVEKDRWVTRGGGKDGDDLFVTGRLGGAMTRKHLQFVPRIAESRWLTKNFSIHAMMDLSDGLGVDLPRLARASKVGFDIQLENLPVARGATIDNAISEGEDYELLFAVSPRDRNRLEREWRRKFPKLLLTRIGSLNHKSPVTDAKQRPGFPIANRKLPLGYIHFQQSG